MKAIFFQQDNVDIDSEGDMYNEQSSSNAAMPGPSTSSSAGPLVTEFSREMFQVPLNIVSLFWRQIALLYFT
jgi:hypothetical protein